MNIYFFNYVWYFSIVLLGFSVLNKLIMNSTHALPHTFFSYKPFAFPEVSKLMPIRRSQGPKWTECPPAARNVYRICAEGSFKLLKSIRCLIRNVKKFQKLRQLFEGRIFRACACRKSYFSFLFLH